MTDDERPVMLLANTGIVIRNLLLGDFADEVVRERPLIVSVPNPRDARLQEIVRGRPIQFVGFPDQYSNRRLTRMEKLKHWDTYMHCFKKAEKNTTSADLVSRVYESVPSPLGRFGRNVLHATGRLLSRTGTMRFVEDRYLHHVRRWPVTSEWRRMFTELRPAAVLSTTLTLCPVNMASADLPPVLAARQAGIPCATMVQSWDNLTSKTAILPMWLDRYWTWSESMSEELLRLYPCLARERVATVGAPQFDFHQRREITVSRETHLRQLGLDPDRPYVLIGGGTERTLPREPDTIMQVVRALNQRLPEVQFLIRLHPKDEGGRWTQFQAELSRLGVVLQSTTPPVHMDEGGFIPPLDFFRDQVNSIQHAAVVLNSSSTLTVDAAILDRPVVCLAFDAVADPKFPEGRAWAFSRSSHYAPLAATGGVALVDSTSACVEAVAAYLADPDLHRRGRLKIVEHVTGGVDGRAGERLAGEFLSLAMPSRSRPGVLCG